MSDATPFTSRARLIGVLAVGQVVSWGTGFDMLAILGPRIGQELAIANEVVFAGLTVMMTISALCGPLLGRTLVRRGAAPVLVAGSLLFTAGFVVLAFAGGVISYVLGWVVMGLAATCGLTTAAHTAVVERVGAESGRSLTLLMVFTGLSAAVFLPVTTVADQHLGWRGTLLVYACLQIFVLLPLYVFVLPGRRTSNTPGTSKTAAVSTSPVDTRRAFLLLAAMTTLSAFTAFGFSPLLPLLLVHAGASQSLAVQLAAVRSVLAIMARGLDFLLGKHGNPFVTCMIGLGMLLASFVLLLVFAPAMPAFIGFIIFFGFGAGVLTVSRAVLPLAVFSPEQYGLQAARISLPQNLAIAVAPVIFTLALDRGGVAAMLTIAAVLISISFLLLIVLWRTVRKQNS
ncbi:MFS permease [Agrobacterium fabacearum CFBP 5771]|jgi:predicted MFS family arabinose efflux permease|uniref:MFS transporter n=1 Tax=Rhizobium/Agrobacterium group TaxID=227290 RepID=UPI0004706F0A|nr:MULTISPECIES: MFS transporter [Rhizobium/Agrobacterium group]NSY58027.1 MFS transporter [Agrobacterium tumefaciens]KQY53336.1 MFS transporter [Rhizobium sp. Root491]NTZ59502.1 MFS transporter [Agrobacterium tumefaciens]OCJ68157.1 MFS transporter [Agrobacterium tumefaciens]UXR90663.1 MFS transporter [Agrobacterium tumefaciens]